MRFWMIGALCLASACAEPEGADGEVGLTGPQGEAGEAGPTGPEGPTGPSGTAGPSGPAGSAGATGAQGPAGPQGVAGTQGATGPQGVAGVPGVSGGVGATGATGPQGLEGSQGPDGPQGSEGPQGPQGSAGDPGIQGPIGPDGATGPAGPTGVAGSDGAPGPMGPSMLWVDATGLILGPATGLGTGYYVGPSGMFWSTNRQTGVVSALEETSRYFTGPNCTGVEFVESPFPGHALELNGTFYDFPADTPHVVRTSVSVNNSVSCFGWVIDCSTTLCYDVDVIRALPTLSLPGPFVPPLHAEWI